MQGIVPVRMGRHKMKGNPLPSRLRRATSPEGGGKIPVSEIGVIPGSPFRGELAFAKQMTEGVIDGT